MIKKLYLVHCGFYDDSLCNGIYESHINLFVAADSFDLARTEVKKHPEFIEKHMHIDGLQEIDAVSGFKITLNEETILKGETHIINYKHRDLAPKTKSQQDGH